MFSVALHIGCTGPRAPGAWSFMPRTRANRHGVGDKERDVRPLQSDFAPRQKVSTRIGALAAAPYFLLSWREVYAAPYSSFSFSLSLSPFFSSFLLRRPGASSSFLCSSYRGRQCGRSRGVSLVGRCSIAFVHAPRPSLLRAPFCRPHDIPPACVS